MTSKTLLAAVATSLAEIAPTVEAKVITHMVDAEVEKRSNAIIKGIEQLNDLRRERQKASKPDVQTFDADGKVQSEGFSKERTESNKKLDEKIDKLIKVLDKALNGDMGDLYNAIK